MKIIKVPIGKLKIPKGRKISNNTVMLLVDSIAKRGLVSPIQIDSGYRIMDGVCRFVAMQRLNKKTIPCYIVLTEKEKIVAELKAIIKRIKDL